MPENWLPLAWLQFAISGMHARYGGYMMAADLFDASLFGVSEAEAEVMDPQQRVLLEVSASAASRLSFRTYEQKRCAGLLGSCSPAQHVT